jgi:hypothetical protein
MHLYPGELCLSVHCGSPVWSQLLIAVRKEVFAFEAATRSRVVAAPSVIAFSNSNRPNSSVSALSISELRPTVLKPTCHRF